MKREATGSFVNLPVEVRYRTLLRIPFNRLAGSALAYDHDRLNLQPGIDLLTRQRGYSRDCLRTPQAHLDSLLASGQIGDQLILTQTQRNAFQNPRTPIYSRAFGICQNAQDDVRQSCRHYYGIARLENNRYAGRALDFRQPIAPEILHWNAAIPVLWDGRILSVEEMMPEVADFAHLWQLDISRHRGANPEHIARFEELTALFRQHLHSPHEEASAALGAATKGLMRENNYLHNLLGVGPDFLVIILAHGPLEYLGELALAAGATHAVVVDNGGSSQLGLKRPGRPLRALTESYYFREPTIALAAFEIQVPDSETIPLVGRHDLG